MTGNADHSGDKNASGYVATVRHKVRVQLRKKSFEGLGCESI